MSNKSKVTSELYKHIKWKVFPPEEWQKDLTGIPDELKDKHLVRAGVVFESEAYITESEYADIVKLNKVTDGLKGQIMRLVRRML